MALSTLSFRLRELLFPMSTGDAARYTAPDVRTLLEASAPPDASPRLDTSPAAPTDAASTAPAGATSTALTRAPAERRDAVLEVAACPAAWTSRLGRQQAWELGRLADRLPTIVALYSAGTPLDEIGRREHCLTTSTVERALDVACACIAELLNARRSADDRLVA